MKNKTFFEISEKSSRKKAAKRTDFSCPTDFAEIIPVINSITDQMIEEYSRIDERYGAKYPPDWSDVFESLPAVVKDYLIKTLQAEGRGKLLPFAVQRCMGIFRDVIAFRKLVHLVERLTRAYIKEPPDAEPPAEMRDRFDAALGDFINPRVQDVLDDPSLENNLGIIGLRAAPDFRLRVTAPPLTVALHGIDMKRVRRCGFCGNIFWAKRIDALGCSRRCSGTLRQRNLRGNVKEEPIEIADDDSEIEFPVRL